MLWFLVSCSEKVDFSENVGKCFYSVRTKSGILPYNFNKGNLEHLYFNLNNPKLKGTLYGLDNIGEYIFELLVYNEISCPKFTKIDSNSLRVIDMFGKSEKLYSILCDIDSPLVSECKDVK